MSPGDLALPIVAQYIGIFGAGFIGGAILGGIVSSFLGLRDTLDHIN